ncbi:MAG: hypothetical protein ABIV63_17670 [Caldimonas sp.]
MQKEAFERAGAQARSLGVPRSKNPFVRVLTHESDRERLSALADHWWRGWDSWSPQSSRLKQSTRLAAGAGNRDRS